MAKQDLTPAGPARSAPRTSQVADAMTRRNWQLFSVGLSAAVVALAYLVFRSPSEGTAETTTLSQPAGGGASGLQQEHPAAAGSGESAAATRKALNAAPPVLPLPQGFASTTSGPIGPDEGDWQALKTRADSGDVRAACKLSLVLEGCRRAAELRSRIDVEIGQLRVDDPVHRDAALADQLASNSDEAAAFDARCGSAPSDVALQEWQYLLAAARAGHEPSMYRFAVFPPIDGERPLDYVEAIAAYKRYAPQFIDELLRRGSAEGLLAAYLVAAGQPIVGLSPLEPRDPRRSVQYGAALSMVRNRPAILDSAVANASGIVSQSEIDSAISEGRGMAGDFRFRFLADGQKSVEPDRANATCDRDW